MTNFTHHLSRVLGEMGIQKETKDWFRHCFIIGDDTQEKDVGFHIMEYSTSSYVEQYPAYRLDDLLTLMPEIEKAMDWDKPIWDCRKIYPKATCESMFCEYAGWKSIRQLNHDLLDAFLEGGYPKAEAYLLSIIEKK